MEYTQQDIEIVYRYYEKKHMGSILFWCKEILYDARDVDEVAQSVLFKFCSNKEVLCNFKNGILGYKGYTSGSTLHTWTRNAAKNRAREIKRKTGKDISAIEDIIKDTFDIEEEAEKKALKEKLLTILDNERTNNPRTYKIINFYFFKVNDLTNKTYTLPEIGTIMGISPEGVRKNLLRFYKRARKILEKENL